MDDTWEVGGAYDTFMGRWSRLVALEFLQWLAVPDGKRWLDVGCGTGMLSRCILESTNPLRVTGIDPAPGFVSYAAETTADNRASFHQGTATSTGIADASVDAVVSGLALNFVPDPAASLPEMKRVVEPGGMIAAYVWDYAAGMQFLRYFWDAAVALDPDAAPLDEGIRFPLCNPDRLVELFKEQGLPDTVVRHIDIPTTFTSFDDYWAPFLAGQGPAPGYVSSLSDTRKEALRERLRSLLPVSRDGSIELSARAWTVRGRV